MNRVGKVIVILFCIAQMFIFATVQAQYTSWANYLLHTHSPRGGEVSHSNTRRHLKQNHKGSHENNFLMLNIIVPATVTTKQQLSPLKTTPALPLYVRKICTVPKGTSHFTLNTLFLLIY